MRRVARRACKRNAAATSARSTVRRPGRTIGRLTRGPARRGLACAIPRVARRDTRRLLARPDACTLPRTGPPARKRRTAVRARATAAVIALIFLRAVDGCGHSARASAALKCSNSKRALQREWQARKSWGNARLPAARLELEVDP